MIVTHSKATFIVTIISLFNNFFTALLCALDHCEVSSSALVEVRFGGRSSDFYSKYVDTNSKSENVYFRRKFATVKAHKNNTYQYDMNGK